jgi:predicted lipoprotein with Yx(FWY)xxD motif
MGEKARAEGVSMRKSFINVSLIRLSLLLFFIIGSELFLIAPSTEAGTTTLSVFPSIVTADVGQNFSINVNVTGVSDLYGWQFSLNWTATILNAVNATEGPFLKSGGNSTFFYYNLNATADQITVDCTRLGNVPGASGSGVLATIKFNVTGSGQSPLNLYNAILLNSQEQAIPSQLSGGRVYARTVEIAVTSVNVSPITVLPGTPVHVNSTVRNLGDSAETFNVTSYANSHAIGVQKVALNSSSSETLFFTWNTTGYSVGDYNVSAVASTVPGETNTTDSAKTAANVVTILYDGHYVAVTRLDTAKDSGKTVIGQGYSTNITITVKNYGIYAESFNTTAYLNTTALHTQKVTLESSASTTINFTWNTSDFAYGNYTISASVKLAQGETNNWTGSFTYGTVKITVPGDINGDGIVNIKDVTIIAFHWLQKVPPAPANADINGDGIVNLLDVTIIVLHWLEHI